MVSRSVIVSLPAICVARTPYRGLLTRRLSIAFMLACQRNETTLILSWLESAFKLDLKIPTHTFPREILHFILHYYTHLLPMVR